MLDPVTSRCASLTSGEAKPSSALATPDAVALPSAFAAAKPTTSARIAGDTRGTATARRRRRRPKLHQDRRSGDAACREPRAVDLARPVPGVQGAQTWGLLVLVLAHPHDEALEHIDRLADVGAFVQHHAFGPRGHR